MNRQPVLQIENVKKQYQMGEVAVDALKGVSFSLFPDEFVVILGPSGSGKSTILNIIGGIDQPTSGDIFYHGQNIAGFGEAQLTKFRRDAVGFVFQFYHLLPNLTARENIFLASHLSATPIIADTLLPQIVLEAPA